MLYLKRKRAEIRSYQGIEVADYSALQRSALTSFLITISHFLMYVPTMLVIGLHGWFLHPIAILICDMVVYAEFLIHPIVLLSTSTKMRKEILHSIKLCIQASHILTNPVSGSGLCNYRNQSCICAWANSDWKSGLAPTRTAIELLV